MSPVLIDTDIASFIFKGSNYADPYSPLLSGQELAISFMTIAELFQWSIVRQWGDRRLVQLEQYLSNYLVIPVDQSLCRQWAIRHDLPLVTHNTSKIFKKFLIYGCSHLLPSITFRMIED
jgi:predicted nucleic acid-binding protein